MKIKIQSVVDLITNSSTETFTILNGNAERIIRDIVDALLASAGSALTFSDLFVFDTKFSDKWEDAYYDYIRDFIKEDTMIMQNLLKSSTQMAGIQVIGARVRQKHLNIFSVK